MKTLKFTTIFLCLIIIMTTMSSCEKRRLNKAQEMLNDETPPCEVMNELNVDNLKGFGMANGAVIIVESSADRTDNGFECDFHLVALTRPKGTKHQWGCAGTLLGTRSTDITIDFFTGEIATKVIADNCTDNTAASAVYFSTFLNSDNLQGEEWFLPTPFEMDILTGLITGETDDSPIYDYSAEEYYWTSQEYDADSAYAYNIETSETKIFHKAEELGLVPMKYYRD